MRIVEETKVARSAKAVLAGLRAYNTAKVGKTGYKRFCFTVQDDAGVMQGGLVGYTLWNGCFVEYFWLAEPCRGQGLGGALLARAEDFARARKCRHIYLDTFSFQGDGFYQKHGYEEFGRIEEFPPGERRLWLKKDLT